jgi:hypothetical protein
METLTFKAEEAFVKEMEEAMSPSYSTKTEFIREAIRDKINDLEKKRALKALYDNFGKGRHHQTTDEDDRRAREQVAKEYAKKFGLE